MAVLPQSWHLCWALPRAVGTGPSHLSVWFVGFHQFHSLASPHKHDLGVPQPSHMQHIPSDEGHHPGGSTAQTLGRKIHFHFKAFSYLTQRQNTLKLQHRGCSQGGTGCAFPTATTAHSQPLRANLAELECAL